MKISIRKKLATVVAILALVAFAFAFSTTNVAKADEVAPVATEFYMEDGADIRTYPDELGIRFKATITKSYWNAVKTVYGENATYKFYSVVTDGTTPIIKDYGNAVPDFEESDTFTFYATVVYKTQDLLDSNLIQAACNLSLSAKTYLDITKAGEDTPITLEAYGETGYRSMKAVANAALLAGCEDQSLSNYVEVGARTEDVEGYVFQDKTGVIEMDSLSDVKDASDLEVYYGAEKISATWSNGKISFSGVTLEDGQTEAIISAFVGGKVYSSKVTLAKKIMQSNVSDLLSLSGSETVVLGEDVDLTGITWNTTVAFNGTFDGNRHEIKNLTTIDRTGFFKTVSGTIKNVAFIDAYTGGNSSVIADSPNGNTQISNVFISLKGKNNYSGAITHTNAAQEYAVNMTDVVVYFPAPSSMYNLFGYMLKGSSTLTNVHVINDADEWFSRKDNYNYHIITQGSIKAGSTVTNYKDLATFATTKTTLTSFLDACAEKYLPVTKIAQSNVGDLLTLKGNETVILTDDIDIAKYMTDNNIENWISSVAFTGTLDGGNHAIMNLTIPRKGDGTYAGLFKSIQGTVRNVAFTNVWLKGECAVLAGSLTGNLTVNNVFIQVSKASGAYRTGIIAERVTSAYTINIEDVVAMMPGTYVNQKLFGWGFTNATANLKNFYGISIGTDLNNPYAQIAPSGKINKDNANFYADLATFNPATKTLTTFLTSCVDKYLNANA